LLKTILPGEMKELETRFMKRTHISSLQLMESAAAHVADAVERHYRGGTAECFCGPGNNGGDGLAAMRILAGRLPEMEGVCYLLSQKLSPDAAAQLERLSRTAPHVKVKPFFACEREPAKEAGLIIDALFGTGLARPLEGNAALACEQMRQASTRGVPVVAVDIPSGLDGENGQVLGCAVQATETVTFHRPKPGLYLGKGPDFCGKVTVVDIGIPQDEPAPEGFSLLEEADLPNLLPKRPHLSHKGSYGRLLVVAGSRGMAGAAALCATAALRSGAGLVTVACPEEILSIVQTLCPCATALPLPEDIFGAQTLLRKPLHQADAVAIGCGLGQSPWAASLVQGVIEMIRSNSKPAVLDADALNLLASCYELPPAIEGCILTPHPAEAARLLRSTTAVVTGDPVRAAKDLCKKYGAAVVLKGAISMLATKERMGLNTFGTPAMAKGGSGDVLTGVIGAFLAGRAAGAYEMDDLLLMQTACAAHGLAGMAAEKCFGMRGVLATDLCGELGRVF